MQEEMPFYESEEDALKAAVQALGGSKIVGPMIWKDKSPDIAARNLLDTLNPDRDHKLAPSQIVLIFRTAREAGFHAPYQWFSNQCGYDAIPITKEEEVDRLLTTVAEASKALENATKALSKYQDAPLRMVR